MRHIFKNDLFTDPGDPIHILYTPKVNADGTIVLEECGKENTDDYIQSFEESTDMEYIIAQLRQGDLSVLNKRPGSYGDFTQAPKTYAEALQLQIDSNLLFNSLPVDVRQKFDHDPNQFFAQSGTEDWFKKIENVLPDDVKAVVFPTPEKVEVTEDVQK